uniref:Secreted protein n=1 Tax=Arundo donax TaxID=35708 RepID=A0A0A9F053_ARUDO
MLWLACWLAWINHFVTATIKIWTTQTQNLAWIVHVPVTCEHYLRCRHSLSKGTLPLALPQLLNFDNITL